MIQALVKKGIVVGEEVPAPNVRDGFILIKTVYSCISAGTEMNSVNISGLPIIKRALKQPDNVKKVLESIKTNGFSKVYAKVKGEIESGKPTGYSLSGIVIGVGKGGEKFVIGDHVTAAGAGFANHAEFVDVPTNLVTKMPDGMSFVDASTVTLGAIALQGVRRANLNLGELAVVVGTGILGLLSVQMLKASGIRVAAVDLDNSRLDIAKELGAEIVINPLETDVVTVTNSWTGGYGADAVLFTAATSSSEPLSQSFQMCRKKGKVILVGVVGLEIKRGDIYKKELDFLISTSYGPGRYDDNYEENGLDYPYAYIRWTENRNMSEYLRLVNSGKIKLDKLINKIYKFENVTEAFNSLKDNQNKPLMVILDYGEPDLTEHIDMPSQNSKIILSERVMKKGVINVAIIGAGSFATNMHLPNLCKLNNLFRIRAIVDTVGSKAKSVAKQFNAQYATTEINDVLIDKDIDLLMITTRHDTHAEFTLRALEAGKHVFVEKPLATTFEDTDKIKNFYNEGASSKPILMVGFNRRFSVFSREIKKHTKNRINPLFIRYRMNAGFIPLDHWVHKNGGRIVGEACHIIDLMTFFTESEIESISIDSLISQNEKYSRSDNKSITLKYNDGSLCVIDYFAVGSKKYGKEYMEIHFDEKTIILDDYKMIQGFGLNVKPIKTNTSQKGQFEELGYLYDVLNGKKENWPIELWDMIQTTKITFKIVNQDL